MGELLERERGDEVGEALEDEGRPGQLARGERRVLGEDPGADRDPVGRPHLGHLELGEADDHAVGRDRHALAPARRAPPVVERARLDEAPGGDDLVAVLRRDREVHGGLVGGVVDRGDPPPGVLRPVVGEEGRVAVRAAGRRGGPSRRGARGTRPGGARSRPGPAAARGRRSAGRPSRRKASGSPCTLTRSTRGPSRSSRSSRQALGEEAHVHPRPALVGERPARRTSRRRSAARPAAGAGRYRLSSSPARRGPGERRRRGPDDRSCSP